jgi:hypothetical protein
MGLIGKSLWVLKNWRFGAEFAHFAAGHPWIMCGIIMGLGRSVMVNYGCWGGYPGS